MEGRDDRRLGDAAHGSKGSLDGMVEGNYFGKTGSLSRNVDSDSDRDKSRTPIKLTVARLSDGDGRPTFTPGACSHREQ